MDPCEHNRFQISPLHRNLTEETQSIAHCLRQHDSCAEEDHTHTTGKFVDITTVLALILPEDFIRSDKRYFTRTAVELIFIFRCSHCRITFFCLAWRLGLRRYRNSAVLYHHYVELCTPVPATSSNECLNRLTGCGEVYRWEASDKRRTGFVKTSLTAFQFSLLRFISTRQ